MDLIDPEKVEAILSDILPNYDKTKDLVRNLHELVLSNYHNLYDLLKNHSEYIKIAEKELPSDENYNSMFQAYYYACLYDLASVYTLNDIFTYINRFEEYDIIDKTIFKCLFKLITKTEAEIIIEKEIKPENLKQIIKYNDQMEDQYLYINFVNKNDERQKIIHPNYENTNLFLRSKILSLYNMFVILGLND